MSKKNTATINEATDAKAAALEGIAATLEGYCADLRESAKLLREGADEDEAMFNVEDVAGNLQFDTDNLVELAGLGYVKEKNEAIAMVAGVSHALACFAEGKSASTFGGFQAEQMASILDKAARMLDNCANRAILFG